MCKTLKSHQIIQVHKIFHKNIYTQQDLYYFFSICNYKLDFSEN